MLIFYEMRKNTLKTFLKKYGHAWILGYFFLYLPWFFHLEDSVRKKYHIVHSELDDFIPFNEYFIIPYLLWFVYVGGAILYFFFTNREDYYRLCSFLFTGMTLFLLVCTLWPNGTDFRPVVDPEKNLCTWLVSFLHRADTCTNVFPSIHAYNSIGVHIAVRKSERLRQYKWLQLASFLLAVSICMATVFLKQHSILDVAGAILLAGAIYPLAYSGITQNERKPKFN